VWGNFQTPAPSSQDPLTKRCPLDRIYSLICPLICINPCVPIWAVAGTVCPYSSPKPQNFEIPGGYFTLHRSSQEPLKKNRPPDRIYSLTCSLRCTNPCVAIWSVAGIVGAQSSPKPKNLEILVWEHLSPCTEVTKNLLKKINLLIEDTVWHALSFAAGAVSSSGLWVDLCVPKVGSGANLDLANFVVSGRRSLLNYGEFPPPPSRTSSSSWKSHARTYLDPFFTLFLTVIVPCP
jgi:hypothetical protein